MGAFVVPSRVLSQKNFDCPPREGGGGLARLIFADLDKYKNLSLT